jgi:hypothetical protein
MLLLMRRLSFARVFRLLGMDVKRRFRQRHSPSRAGGSERSGPMQKRHIHQKAKFNIVALEVISCLRNLFFAALVNQCTI